ncbi:MAG: SRPBCC domain-containing protein [Lysobacterales bacterium]
MKVVRKADHEVGEDTARTQTGKSLSEWFALIDAQGGPDLGRREIGQWLYAEMKLDPWWSATINNEYELARGVREKDGTPRGYTICATKTIKADAARCYAEFADASAWDGWFGSGHVLELRDGGSLTNDDGNRATIKKVNPAKNLRLIWDDADLTVPTPVEIKFSPTGAKTTVMVTIDRLQTRAEADGYRRAWGEALDRLKQRIEGA